MKIFSAIENASYFCSLKTEGCVLLKEIRKKNLHDSEKKEFRVE